MRGTVALSLKQAAEALETAKTNVLRHVQLKRALAIS